jgi:hypothetical protein
MARIIQLLNTKCCVACYLTFYKAKSISMIFILRASAVNDTIASLRPPCSFVTVDEETCIGEEVISILLEVAIVGT